VTRIISVLALTGLFGCSLLIEALDPSASGGTSVGSPDAGSPDGGSPADAGTPTENPCSEGGTLDLVSGECSDKYGADSTCPEGQTFHLNHPWVVRAHAAGVTVRYVAKGKSGVGSESDPAGTIVPALEDGEDASTTALVAVLGEGDFSITSPLRRRSVTLVGLCPAKTIISSEEGPALRLDEVSVVQIFGIGFDARNPVQVGARRASALEIDRGSNVHLEQIAVRGGLGHGVHISQTVGGRVIVRRSSFAVLAMDGLRTVNVDGVLIADGNHFSHLGGHGISLSGVGGQVDLSRNDFAESIEQTGIRAIDGVGFWTVDGNPFRGVGGLYAIEFSHFSNETTTVSITRNAIGPGPTIGIFLHDNVGFWTVDGNPFRGVDQGVLISESPSMGGLSVSGNELEDIASVGIGTMRTNGIGENWATIADNTISGNGAVGGDHVLASEGVRIVDSGGITVSGNGFALLTGAAVLIDLRQWGDLANHAALAGPTTLTLSQNTFAPSVLKELIKQDIPENVTVDSEGVTATEEAVTVDRSEQPSGECGDGYLDEELAEACDDGNQVGSDSCTNLCELAVCGDGVLRTDAAPDEMGYEACDWGSRTGNIGINCLPNCQLPVHQTLSISDRYGCVATMRSRARVNTNLICWGEAGNFGAGLGDFEPGLEPLVGEVQGLGALNRTNYDIVSVATSTGEDDLENPERWNAATCALNEIGSLYCWGSAGAVPGLDSFQPSAIQVRLPERMRAVRLALGPNEGCVIDERGALQCWARRHSFLRAAGVEAEVTQLDLRGPGLGARVSDLALGTDHLCVIADGAVWCMGDSSHGQAGRTQNPTTFVQVEGASRNGMFGMAQVFAGYKRSCARSLVGVLSCWGNNEAGAHLLGPVLTPLAGNIPFSAAAFEVALAVTEPIELSLTPWFSLLRADRGRSATVAWGVAQSALFDGMNGDPEFPRARVYRGDLNEAMPVVPVPLGYTVHSVRAYAQPHAELAGWICTQLVQEGMPDLVYCYGDNDIGMARFSNAMPGPITGMVSIRLE
jgi:cysteine-rich repeat protein